MKTRIKLAHPADLKNIKVGQVIHHQLKKLAVDLQKPMVGELVDTIVGLGIEAYKREAKQ